MNYYDLLEVSKNASKEVIEMAYKAQTRKYHPDINPAGDTEKCEEYIKVLNEAKRILTDEELRMQYDEYLERIENNITTDNNGTLLNEELDKTKPRPWIRFFARVFDINMGTLIIMYIWMYLSPSSYNSIYNLIGTFILGMVLCLIWIVIEAYIISSTGTTLGKWLLNTKVRNVDNSKLTYKSALYRNLTVFMRGMWASVPYLSYIPMVGAYNRLKANNILEWDIIGCSKVVHNRLNVFKVIIFVCSYIALVYLRRYGL